MNARTTVVIADDHPIYREGVSRAIKERPDLELVGEAGDGRAALEAIIRLSPEVALLDLELPEMSGIEVTEAIAREGVPTRVLVLSAFSESELVYKAVAAGAMGYLTKDCGRREICDAIVAVARGDGVMPPQLQGGLLNAVRQRESADRPALTDREREVLTLTAEGLSGPDIAAQLFLSPTTVKSHLQNVYEKLGVSDRAAAVAEAMRRRMLD